MSEAMPVMMSDAWMSRVSSVADRSHTPAMIMAGATTPMAEASTCERPSGMIWTSGGLPSQVNSGYPRSSPR